MASAPSPTATENRWKWFLEDLEHFKEDSTFAADIFTLTCFLVFAFLIGSEVYRAFKKRATWLPGKAFALSGVTVQIIVWWTSLSNIYPAYERDFRDLVFFHEVVVSGRVAVCVFIGYLLPGMAAPSVRVFGALAITICAQIASELLLLYNPESETGDHDGDIEHVKKKYPHELTWSKIADLILLICVIVLGLILCCTVLASKTIRGLLRQRVSAIAEENKFQFSNENMTIWDVFEGEVLKSCFVARVSQVNYVISRSVLSSAVWIIVTICVIVFYKSYGYFWFPLPFFMFPLLSFITMGWVVISWRWLTAQLYCPPRLHSQRRWFCFEDFWTSNIVEWIDMYDLKRERRRFQKSKSKMQPSLNKSQGLCTRLFTKVRLHKLLYLVLILQVCVVLFCKVCGLLSELVVGEFLYLCRSFVYWSLKYKTEIPPENYTKILECFCMPGEDLSILWEANKMSLNKAKRLMKKGCKEGSSSEEINSFFRQYSIQWAEDGMKILKKLKEKAIPSVLSHFSSVEKQCVKMTVVSLITILIGLHKAKSDRLTKAMKACHQVWDLVSFADECDIDLQADKINLLVDLNKDSDQVCMAANREFYKLQMEYEKLDPECEDCLLDSENVHGFLKGLLDKSEKNLKKENILQGDRRFPRDLSDSRNWTKLVPSYALYKLCKLMQAEDIQDFVVWTENSLRNVIASSMSKLPDILVKQCWIWAKEFEEDKLWEAIQLAGKCRGMMEEWGHEPKPKVNTTQPKTLYQRFKMWILCRPVEEQKSQGDQTLSSTEQCTIEVNESPSQGVSTGTR